MPDGRWGESFSNKTFDIRSRVVAGAVAGNIAVTGIKKSDELITVINLSAAGANLYGEFKVSANDQINNTAGTNTTGMLLLVQWVPAATGRTGY